MIYHHHPLPEKHDQFKTNQRNSRIHSVQEPVCRPIQAGPVLDLVDTSPTTFPYLKQVFPQMSPSPVGLFSAVLAPPPQCCSRSASKEAASAPLCSIRDSGFDVSTMLFSGENTTPHRLHSCNGCIVVVHHPMNRTLGHLSNIAHTLICGVQIRLRSMVVQILHLALGGW